ncbi:MAG: Beta-galactosidase C-terminal domain, partial [Anaerolineae bacterium]|nr:Beta-galactosidase C-terminal domain [Anaerolineae bacterium]
YSAQSQYGYEQLDLLPGTSTIARWEKRHLRMKAAASLRKVGEGAVVYVGTYLTEEILTGLLQRLVDVRKDLVPSWPTAPDGVHVVVRENDEKRLWFFINDGGQVARLMNPPEGVDLITGKEPAVRLYIKKNEVIIIKQQLLS